MIIKNRFAKRATDRTFMGLISLSMLIGMAFASMLSAGVAGSPSPTRAGQAVVVKNPYAEVNWEKVNQYQANFHSHTVYSDGRAEPAELIHNYAEAGYHILAISDHDNYHTVRSGERQTVPTADTTWPWTRWIDEEPSKIWSNEGMETSAFYPDLGEHGMLAIRANELTTHPHIVSLFNDCGWPDRNQTDDQRMSCVQEKNGLAYWAHPADYVPGGRWERNVFDASWDEALNYLSSYIVEYDSLLGFEMQLGCEQSPFDRREKEEELLDRLLTRYYRDHDIFIMGSDDSHFTSVSDDATITIVLAEDLTEEAVRHALENGHKFVGSRVETLPVFNGITVDEDEQIISLDIDNHDGVVWIANGKRHHEGESVAYAEMDDTVLRFEVNAGGAVFYSQAFYIAAANDKTLVAWVTLDTLDQSGGSVLTLQREEEFDAIVYAERAERRWMAGSDMFNRTQTDQTGYAAEDAEADELVQIAIVYSGGQIQIYRQGDPYASYEAQNIPLMDDGICIAVFGWRHIGARSGSPFAGSIEDARIYDQALSAEQIRSLQPNEASDIEPWAWWDFSDAEITDRAGRFTHHAMTAGVTVADGRLHLDGQGYLVAGFSETDVSIATRENNPQPPAAPDIPAWPVDPPDNWVTFHLAHPGPGVGIPGDPNPAFDHKGRYHLHYIYNHNGFKYAHVSSNDMVRWDWHPTVLCPRTTGHGMFSGTGFFTKDGTPAMIYHGQGSDRNWIQLALDDQLDSWSEPQAVIPRTESGEEHPMREDAGQTRGRRHWDPDLFLMDGKYYAYSGGFHPQLMVSDDLENWTYLGDLFHPDYCEDTLGVPLNIDVSCGNMFKIGDKWMLLNICHTRGCRYYLGDWKDGQYLPESHHMMSFGNRSFFAPESMLTRDGRRIMWAWLCEMPIHPSGVQSLPRELELPEDGVLRIRPLRELASLRHEPVSRETFTLAGGSEVLLEEVVGDAVEMEVTFAWPLPESCGIDLLFDEHGNGGVRIVARSGHDSIQVGTSEAPFELKSGEDLTLRVFIDKNLVEVFINDRQAVAYAVSHRREDPNIRLFAENGDATVESFRAWKMKSIYSEPPPTPSLISIH